MSARILHTTLIALACCTLSPDYAIGKSQPTEAAPAPTKVVESSFIFPTQGYEHVHSSSIVELPDGALLAAWFQGSGESSADDVRILGARKPVGAAKWSEPFLLADTLGHPDCNPVLWIDKDKRLWLFWSAILSNDWDSSLMKYRISTNYTAAGPPKWDWQDNLHLKPANFQQHMLSGWRPLLSTILFVPRSISAELSAAPLSIVLLEAWKLFAVLGLLIAAPIALHVWRRRRTGRSGWGRFFLRTGLLYAPLLIVGAMGTFGYFALQSSNKLNQRLGWLTANSPVQLASGEIVLPLYSDRFLASIMAISSDGGTTWEASAPLIGYGNIQPTLIERRSGELVAWMRESGLRKRIRCSTSSDRGRTWSAVSESELPNPGSKVAITPLANGDWVMAYNPLVDGRHSLCLAISHDEGKSWRTFHSLDETIPEVASFSYPSLIETSDGRLQVTYSHRLQEGESRLETIKHVSLCPPALAPEVELAKDPRATRL